jgi:hypothetical protein
MNTSPKSLATLLVFRSQWEEIVRRYNIPKKDGTLDNLVWFVTEGYRPNKRRTKCAQAVNLAQAILEGYEDGICQETTARQHMGSSG